MSEVPCQIVVAGRIDDKNFHAARKIAQELAEIHSNVTCVAQPMFATEWGEYVKAKAAQLGKRHKVSPLVFYNTRHYIGTSEDLSRWAERAYGFVRPINSVVCQSTARSEFRLFLQKTKHRFCYLDVALCDDSGESKAAVSTERVVIELFDDLCPKTCRNFELLCTGENGPCFAGTPFHRVVAGGWVQGGDTGGGSGSGGEAVFGGTDTLPDETFAVKHDRAGIVSMANKGMPHTNGSQFFVTLAPLPWLDLKRVAFGKVVYGMRTFNMIEQLPRKNERPQGLCTVYGCGLFTGDSSLKAAPYKKAAAARSEEKEEKEEKQ